MSLQSQVRRLGKHISVEDQLKIYEKRHRLQSRIDAFVTEGQNILRSDADDTSTLPAPVTARIWEDEDRVPVDETDDTSHNPTVDPESDAIYPEWQILPLPSSRSITAESPKLLRDLAEMQLQLEQGQANDALHKLRLAIGHKSFLYRYKVRRAPNYDSRTRAYDDVRSFQTVISTHADVYSACRQAMIALHADEDTMRIYQVLKREDLRTDTAVVNPNERGQRNNEMSWIWGVANPETASSPEWMEECKFCTFAILSGGLTSIQSIPGQLSPGPGTDVKMEGRKNTFTVRDGMDKVIL